MTTLPRSLTALFPEEICSAIGLSEKFRGKQVFKWLASGVNTLDAMSNIPKTVKESITVSGIPVYATSVIQKLEDTDGTIKFQIGVTDTAESGFSPIVETVMLTDRDGRKTACISTQIGCAMKCAFCKTGQLGFLRNLSAGEIVEQFYTLERETKSVLDNVVFMGMGEPMLNLQEVRKAVVILSHTDGRMFSKRRFTLSTSGIISGIRDLADNGPDIKLAVSLTVANQQIREQLMPVAKTNKLNDLKNALRYFTDKTGTRITLEAALMHDVNTNKESARELIDFAHDLHPLINLIPWNPVDDLPFTEPTASETAYFAAMLEKAGLQITIRKHRGRKIGGACGQLGKTGLSVTTE